MREELTSVPLRGGGETPRPPPPMAISATVHRIGIGGEDRVLVYPGIQFRILLQRRVPGNPTRPVTKCAGAGLVLVVILNVEISHPSSRSPV